MNIDQTALEAFKQHALDVYPQEACGVLCGAIYIPCRNTAADPLRDFRIAAKELVEVKAKYGKVDAILHSHPYNPTEKFDYPHEWPSENDMTSWIKSKKPWGIAACDGEGISQLVWLNDKNRPPLVGRKYVWGDTDCFTLIRDWYAKHGVKITNYPRAWGHWKHGKSMYDAHFAAEGFVEVAPTDVKVGDLLLMRYGTRVAAHAAVVTGPDEILHHLVHRQSGHDTLHKWLGLVTKCLRHPGVKQ